MVLKITKNIDEREDLKKCMTFTSPNFLTKRENTIYYDFQNIDYLVNVLKKYDDHKTKYTNSKKEDKSWAGSNSLDETYKIITGRHQDKSTKDLKANVINKLKIKGIIGSYIVENYHFTESDGEIDIERYLSGEKKCFLKANQKYTDKFFDIIVDITILHDIKINSYSKNIVNIIEAVYNAEVKDGLKIRVILAVMTNNSASGSNLVAHLIAKNYDERINLDRFLGIFHKSTFRRAFFRLLELTYDENLDSGYGRLYQDNCAISMNTNDEIKPEEIQDRYMQQLTFGKS